MHNLNPLSQYFLDAFREQARLETELKNLGDLLNLPGSVAGDEAIDKLIVLATEEAIGSPYVSFEGAYLYRLLNRINDIKNGDIAS